MFYLFPKRPPLNAPLAFVNPNLRRRLLCQTDQSGDKFIMKRGRIHHVGGGRERQADAGEFN